jgi:DNA processing protein
VILKKIYDPPPVFYYEGRSLNENNAALAVVGTQAPSAYGRSAAERLTRDLASLGICIISGMARGSILLPIKARYREKA